MYTLALMWSLLTIIAQGDWSKKMVCSLFIFYFFYFFGKYIVYGIQHDVSLLLGIRTDDRDKGQPGKQIKKDRF